VKGAWVQGGGALVVESTAVMQTSDVDSLTVPGNAKVAGGAGLLTGVFECVLAAQTVAVLRGPLQFPTAGAMLGLGMGLAYSGFRVGRGSGKAALVEVVVGSVSILVVGAWSVFTLLHGVLSPLALLVAMVSIVVVAVAAVALPALRRLDAARERLRAEGLDTGL
jgi:hypothetical protein